jgi:hypothetical protein
MSSYFNLAKSETKKLPYLTDEEYQIRFNKGWSYSYVYSFSEIRNIFILLRKYGFSDLKSFYKLCIENKLPAVKTPWSDRRILEHINALKNFGLISENSKILRSDVFHSADLMSAISDEDLLVFEEIFFSYYRFKEILSWLVDPVTSDRSKIIDKITKDFILTNSKTVFPFNTMSRFTDSFVFELKDNTPVYQIQNSAGEDGDMVRFWDVFCKWATELRLIEKFNLKNLDYQLSHNYKSLSCLYFKQNLDTSFDLLKFISENYQSKYINVPKLIFRIATIYRFSIDDIKRLIIKISTENSSKFSLQRTSEIFIRDTEINFVPKVNDSYISHILLT